MRNNLRVLTFKSLMRMLLTRRRQASSLFRGQHSAARRADDSICGRLRDEGFRPTQLNRGWAHYG